jgi:hypothetical protein
MVQGGSWCWFLWRYWLCYRVTSATTTDPIEYFIRDLVEDGRLGLVRAAEDILAVKLAVARHLSPDGSLP